MAITFHPDGRIQKNGVEIGTQQGGGLMRQAWYLSAAFTTSVNNTNNDVTTNFVKHTDANAIYSSLGTENMTQSSGVFTFPSTGIYEITSKATGSRFGGDNKYVYWITWVSTNSGSSYDVREQGTSCMYNKAGTNTVNIYSNLILNVTNASSTRIKFGTYGGNNAVTIGSGADSTSVTFTKLSEL